MSSRAERNQCSVEAITPDGGLAGNCDDIRVPGALWRALGSDGASAWSRRVFFEASGRRRNVREQSVYAALRLFRVRFADAGQQDVPGVYAWQNPAAFSVVPDHHGRIYRRLCGNSGYVEAACGSATDPPVPRCYATFFAGHTADHPTYGGGLDTELRVLFLPD